MSTPETTTKILHPRWPASRFYWAVVTPAVLGNLGHVGAVPPQATLETLLAEVLPVELSDVHAVFVSLGERGVLACAAPIRDLESLPESTRTLSPDGVPGGIAELVPPETVASFNLLQGMYEPASVRHARQGVWTSAAWMAAAVIAIVGLGLHLRASADRRRAMESQQAAQRIASDAIATRAITQVDGAVKAGQQNALDQLHTVVSRLSRERGDQASGARPADAAVAMAALLGLWPKVLATRMDSLAFGEASIRLTGSVPSFEEASVLTDALKAVPGWNAEQPQVTAQGNRVSVRTNLTRSARSPRTVGVVSAVGAGPIQSARDIHRVSSGDTP